MQVWKRLQHMFSWEICESFKNTYFEEHLRITASVNSFLVMFFFQILFDIVSIIWKHFCKNIYIASYHVYQLTFGVSFNIFCFCYIGKCQFYHTKLSFSKIIKRSRKFTVNKENVKTVSIEVYAVSHWSLEQSFAGNLAVIYLFQLNSGNTRTICKICWKFK